MKAKHITSEWYPFYQVYVHESETAKPIPLLTTTTGAPVATAEGAELLGITADKLVMACRRGALSRGRGVRKTEIREVAVVSHSLQQRGAAEAGDVKFAVEQRMESAVMLLQEVRDWPGGQGVLSGYELYTDIELDTAVAIPRDFACDVREKVLSKKYTFVVLFGTIWRSVQLPCHGDVSQDDLWSMLRGRP